MNDRTPKAKAAKTPLERMTELTRRLVAVRKDELPAKRKHRRTKKH